MTVKIDDSPLVITAADLDSWINEQRWDNSPRLSITLNHEFDYSRLRYKHVKGWWFAEHQGFLMAHFHNMNPEKQNGYGGRAFPIVMEDGEEKTLYGPWNGNTASFFKDTGIRCMDMHHRVGDKGYAFGWWATIPRVLEALKLVPVPNKKFITSLIIDDHGQYTYALMKPIQHKQPHVLQSHTPLNLWFGMLGTQGPEDAASRTPL